MTFCYIKLSGTTFPYILYHLIQSHTRLIPGCFRFTNTHLGYLKSLLYVASHVESVWDNCEMFIKIP